MIILLLFSIEILSITCQEKIIPTQYSFENHALLFSFMVNQFDFIEFHYPININGNYTLLEQITIDNRWNLISPSILLTSPKETTLLVQKIKKQISFYPDTTINYTFYNTNNHNTSLFPKYFSLSYKYIDNDLSIIHQLHKSNLISSKKFSFLHNNYSHFYLEYPSNLFFGGFPSSLNSLFNNSHLLICKQSINIPQWSCHLKNVILLSNNKYSIFNYVKYIYWNSMTYHMMIPIKFKEYLKESIFGDYINRNICVYRESNMFRGSFLDCDCEIMEMLPTIWFEFENGKGVELEFGKMFEKVKKSFIEHERCELMMKVNYEDDTFMFGNKFMRMFDMEFDYDENEVRLYSELYVKSKQYIIIHKENEIKNMYIINILINSIMCIFIFFIKNSSSINE